ncbi:hypothetical protein [Streptomyces sp. KN37]|uniref:hypothetical protein n=1 Tax=Streptomyces sp. KN37 TaxID=3090667 RepID=UPI002A74E217|nr:hypothetical protein [Streptomyces sp. KN37]WPO69938.1 hypothetical protein R9806_04480 [Streptomyces sp. KN37]
MKPSNLPEQYRRYVADDQQPLTGKVELSSEREAAVWVPGAYGGMVAVRKSQVPAPLERKPVRDLTPQPLFDPVAQRLLGVGLGGGTLLWGGGMFLAGASQFVSSLSGASALLFFMAIAGARAVLGSRGGTYVRSEQHTHVHQKWLGRTNISNHSGGTP